MRQYDLLTNCIEIDLKNDIEAFDKYTLRMLNDTAVANIAQFGGRFRKQPIYVGNHIPPHFDKVPNLLDQFLSDDPRKLAHHGSSDCFSSLRSLAIKLDTSIC